MTPPGRPRSAVAAATRARRVPVAAGAAEPAERVAPAAKGPRELPVLPVRHTVLFPFAILPLNVGRERNVALLNDVMAGDRTVAVLAQRDATVEEPGFGDLYTTGAIGTVVRMVRFPDERYSVLLQGVERVRLVRPVADQPYLRASFEALAETTDGSVETEALVKNVLEQFERVVALVPALPDEAVNAARNQSNPGQVADFIASLLELPTEDKQRMLETLDARERLRMLTGILGRELQVLEVGAQIRDQVKESLDQHQREFLLRQQLEAIRKELGEGDDAQREIEELRAKLDKAQPPPDVRKEADRELARLRTIPPQAAEYTVARTYLEWLAEMPWNVLTQDDLDLAHARAVLDEDHYGLEKIKERILEYLVVRKFKGDARTPILCFVGPPGTGKTSLGRSIARALGRRFVRQSLGGVRDEAEIRGHRRTYIGALPGQIVRGIRRAGSRNPLFMLDEVDKLGADFHGDPSSALLEVLDPEQNSSFTDHYLDVPFDLSQVLFITTANILDTIPPPLRDRMEIIRLSGYTDAEKLEIARRHLIPKATRENGLESLGLSFTDEAVLKVVHEYTGEAGLRNLERELANLLRKTAKEIAEGRDAPRAIGPERVRELLGPERYQNEKVQRIQAPGAALGLAWTPIGGEVLTVESAIMPGQRQLILTGQLGDVMKESAQAALSYLRANAARFGIAGDFFDEHAFHVHVPAGAIPKDGPSAGVTMLCALASAAVGRPVRRDLAMTGEITLRGEVLPVGGIKEKALAALRAGIHEICLPRENRRDLAELPASAKAKVRAHLIDRADEVLRIALLQAQPPVPPT